ncbi:MAG: nucleoside 2-deoxyribosyltransferase domain-containing protein, partial [Nanoarchaeota archaeon]|nr:nucleoside 2-deoxyribosyltransferase domain-containing protein [Nanoarchaeota archaeon]
SITLLNPRRKNFPIHDPNAPKNQTTWEYNHLRKADAISFWFPKEAICTITLYELGAWSMKDKPLFVGVHDEYSRKIDIEIQTELIKPEIKIVYSLNDLAKQIKKWSR